MWMSRRTCELLLNALIITFEVIYIIGLTSQQIQLEDTGRLAEYGPDFINLKQLINMRQHKSWNMLIHVKYGNIASTLMELCGIAGNMKFRHEAVE